MVPSLIQLRRVASPRRTCGSTIREGKRAGATIGDGP